MRCCKSFVVEHKKKLKKIPQKNWKSKKLFLNSQRKNIDTI